MRPRRATLPRGSLSAVLSLGLIDHEGPGDSHRSPARSEWTWLGGCDRTAPETSTRIEE
jgi:hypothetical protein